LSVPALVLALALAGPAHGADAPADTTLHRYLGGLADSTDAYFGITGAAPDTAAFDSLLAAALGDPEGHRRRMNRTQFTPGPWLGFNRVLGPLWGGSLGVSRRSLGTLEGKLGYAEGTEEWMGGGEYRLAWSARPRAARGYALEPQWRIAVRGGRFQGVMDPDRRESLIAVARALVWGTDRQHYLRRDGVRASLTRESGLLRVVLDARDELESPQDVTATWNLYGRDPAVTFNLPARLARVRELGAEASLRLGTAPAWVEFESRWSDDAWGSDLTYTRLRAAVAADVPVGGVLAVIPQATWGRLDGRDIPQASFFLGGATSLRSVPSWSIGGTRKALARLDVLTSPRLFEPLHLPEQLPIQLGVFGGIGAAWGEDPYGGPGSPEDEWPERHEWLSEAGGSLLYRPGIPDPRGFIRFDWAWPIGPDDRAGRFTVYYSRAIDLLRVPDR
jgi:hypothetical protein